MNPILRNVLVVIGGWLVGSIVNMGIILLSVATIGVPDAVDIMDPNSIKENLHLFSTPQMISPIVAHAVGTLVGAYFVARLAANNHMRLALLIGVIFLIGGIINNMNIDPPAWFKVVDLLLAYLPMAYLGGKLAGR